MNKKILSLFVLFILIIQIPIIISKEIDIDEELIKKDDGWIRYPPYPNYAPSGMPDFNYNQQRDWTENQIKEKRLGPYAPAIANVLWYLDSKYSIQNGYPGDGIDEFPLVYTYNYNILPNPGPLHDDHNFNNVNDRFTPWHPLIDYSQTELIENIRKYIGNTDYSSDQFDGLKNYLNDINLDDQFIIEWIQFPTIDIIEKYIINEWGMFLEIQGFDENGNHAYGWPLSISGINKNLSLIEVCDPIYDNSNPTYNSIRHNDAQYVSHDVYPLSKNPFPNFAHEDAVVIDYPYLQNDFLIFPTFLDYVFVFRPNTPPIPVIYGNSIGKCNSSYRCNISCFDPQNDSFRLLLDWGDNSTTKIYGPYNSEINRSFDHIWTREGNFTIRVKAIDKHDAESEWVTLKISITKTKKYLLKPSKLMWLIERFPMLEPILSKYL